MMDTEVVEQPMTCSNLASGWMETKPFRLPLLRALCELAVPNILSYIAELMLPISTTFFLGHLDSSYLAAAVVANMWCNAFGFSFLLGLAMGLDSLAPQAFGSQEKKLVGLYCQRALVISTLACIPIAVVWMLSDWGLQLIFRIDPTLSALAGQWVWARMAGMWPGAAVECLKRYVQSQNVAWPMPVAVAVVAVLHVGITYLMVGSFGYLGAAFSISISQWLLLAVLLLVLLIRERFSVEVKLGQCWPPINLRDVFSGWAQYLRFSAPSAAALFIEWGGYEVYTAIAAQVGPLALAAQSIMAITSFMWYLLPLGFAIACSTLAGIALGRGDALEAQSVTVLTLAVVIGWGLVNGGFGMLYRTAWSQLFTDDAAVVAVAVSMFPTLWVYGIFDSIKALSTSILRSIGHQRLTVVGSLVSQLLVGYPISFVCSRYWGLPGVWFGITATWLSCCVIYLAVIFRTDWQLQVRKTAMEVAIGKGSRPYDGFSDHLHDALIDGGGAMDDDEGEADEAVIDEINLGDHSHDGLLEREEMLDP